jgi:putative transposase
MALGTGIDGTKHSLREGMTETLTVFRRGVPPTLAPTLRSTNSIESTIHTRTHSRNVKHGQKARWLRWCAAGITKAGGLIHKPRRRRVR